MSGLLGLISFAALAAFSLLYLSASIPKKNEAVEKALSLIKQNVKFLGVACAAYGFIAFCLTPVVAPVPLDMFLRLLGNLVLIIMALPYCFTQFEAQLAPKLNEAILAEIKHIIGMITAQEKIVGFIGAAMTVVTFIFVFR